MLTTLAASTLKLALLYGGLQATDQTITELALRRPNTYEANPLQQSFRNRTAMSVLSTAAIVILDREAGKRNRKVQKVLRISYIVLKGAIIVNNVSRMK
jgi:hypothetical protein